MSLFLCKLWPYLAGGLIGWLLAGWFARRLKHVEPPVEKIIEKHVDKVVDNPKHLSLIGKLESENKKIPDLVSRIAAFESAKPITSEKVVEKVVDNPKHIARIKELETQNKDIASLKRRISSFENQQSKTSDHSENDYTEYLKRISELESQVEVLKQGPVIDLKAARAAGIKIKDDSDFTAIEGIGPKINDLIHADKITTFGALADTQPSTIQNILDNAGSSYAMANPGTWPDQANLAVSNRWGALKALQDVLDGGVYPDGSKASSKSSATSSTKKASKPVKKAPIALDIKAAKAAGFKVKQSNNGQDDFTVIEGIGPKINGLIHDDGIHTFTELSKTLVDAIQDILDKAGPRYKLAKPGTWPAQAEMAASNRWDALKVWQDELDGGE